MGQQSEVQLAFHSKSPLSQEAKSKVLEYGPDNFGGNIQTICEGEMFTGILPTTHLKILCEIKNYLFPKLLLKVS